MNLPVNMFAEYQATYIHDKRYVVTKNWNFRVLKYFLKDFKSVYQCFVCMHVGVPRMCTVPHEARGGD